MKSVKLCFCADFGTFKSKRTTKGSYLQTKALTQIFLKFHFL